ncbi:MAG: response regulator [Polyangiaceae bacterium]|nr:response regulator [Polyangiaceae bacterium]
MTARVLVVDDHRDMADGVAMLLGELGLEVEVSYSAEAALASLARTEFALVLSDVRMPGMDGVALLGRVRERWPHTRVVLLTGHGTIDSAVEAMRDGASDYLTKPFDNQALVEVVRRHVAGALGPAEDASQALVAEVAALLSPDDLFGSLATALEAVRRAAGADDCELFLAEPEGRDAVLSVWAGPDGDALMDRTRFEPNVGYPGIVTATSAPISVQGAVGADARYLRRRVAESGIRSYACVPLLEPRAALGSLHLLSRRPDFPVDQAVRVLERVAVPIASAIRAGLAALRQAVDELCVEHDEGSREQLEALLAHVCRAAGAEDGTIVLVDPETGAPARTVSTGTATQLCSFAEAGAWCDCPPVRQGHGVTSDGGRRGWAPACRQGVPRRVTTPCCLPLVANGRFLGLITVDLGSRGQGRGFSRLVPLLVIAQQIAVRLTRGPASARAESGSDRPAAVAPAAELEVRCLGPFEVVQRGALVPADRFSRSKALTLLKLLALRAGTPVSRDFLIDKLWEDADLLAGANRLHGVVHALRTVIEPRRADRAWTYVKNRGDLYYLDLNAPVDVDLARYRKLVGVGLRPQRTDAAESIALLEQAVALYRGELFADDPYAEWCEQERRELLELQVGALERLAKLHAADGDVDRAILHLRRATLLAPYREAPMVALLELLVDAGRANEARAHYEEFRRLVVRELGMEPSTALEAFRKAGFRSAPRVALPVG